MGNNMYRSVILVEKTLLHRRLVDTVEIAAGSPRLYVTNIGSGKMKEYEGRKLVGFSAEQMYNVVADVENYRKFVPFCKKSDILSRGKDLLRASLVIGFPPINESYVSKVTMIRPHIVKAECTDGKLFNHLNTLWMFSPGLKNNSQTCIVRQMENAFEDEARRRYGRPRIKTVRLEQ